MEFFPINQKLSKKLDIRTTEGNLRELKISSGLIDFFSNDYLGLARNIQLGEKINKTYEALAERKIGATGSRLLSGNSVLAMQLEQELAQLFKGEKALLFNAGFVANTSLISSISQKGDTIIFDELAHASMREGCLLSFAKSFKFKHNDIVDLENKLKRTEGNVFVLIESVYSMDGDCAPLVEIVSICEKYQAHLIVDEAHSTGIYGKGGNGLLCDLELEKKVFARVYTFGKAMGCHGACIVGSDLLIQYLINFARGFIYSTSMPSHNLVSIREAFAYIQAYPFIQEDLQARIHYFRNEIQQNKKVIPLLESHSAIQVLKIPGNENCKRIAEELISKGFDVRAILSPTVKAGEERLRICFHNYNTEEEISGLVKAISHHAL